MLAQSELRTDTRWHPTATVQAMQATCRLQVQLKLRPCHAQAPGHKLSPGPSCSQASRRDSDLTCTPATGLRSSQA